MGKIAKKLCWMTCMFAIGFALMGTTNRSMAINIFLCTGIWKCAGNNFNGCNFTAGQVPSCEYNPDHVCFYNTPGWICAGKTAGGADCTVDYTGCP
jgi:hypothetical protein